jgi:uncharacterized membrane protein YgdD (TMEM256/DUF423 family)
MKSEKILFIGSLSLLLAVAIGAFGAHGLKEIVTGKYLETFKTGVQYQYYHGFGLLLLGIIQMQFKNLDLKKPALCFMLGIFLFSFNCYLYAITSNKVFAMIVPIGGIFFMIGWSFLTVSFYRKIK